jgi:hypothetical protein
MSRLVRTILVLSTAAMNVLAHQEVHTGVPLWVRGIVHSITRIPVSHERVSIQKGGSYETTDTGQFIINTLPIGTIPGRAIQLEVAHWVIVHPNDGGNGRVYMPDPTEPPIPVTVTYPGDRPVLLSDDGISNLLFERFFRLESDENEVLDSRSINEESPTRIGTFSLMEVRLNSISAGDGGPSDPSSPASTDGDALRTRGFLFEKSSEFGISFNEIVLAINSWIRRIGGDPYDSALASLYEGDYPLAALNASKAATKGAKKEFESNVLLGYADFKLGRLEEAQQALNRSLLFHPNDSILKLNLNIVKRESVLKKLRDSASSCVPEEPAAGSSGSTGFYISATRDAPFSAKVLVEWSLKVDEGPMRCHNYFMIVARDVLGRVHQEVWYPPSTLISIAVSEPAQEGKTLCIVADKTCRHVAADRAFDFVLAKGPPGLSDGGRRYIHRESGDDTLVSSGPGSFTSEKVFHDRTVTFQQLLTDEELIIRNEEIWSSSDLGINLKAIHQDNSPGMVIINKLINLSRSEPDPGMFEIPAGFQMIENQ